MKKIIFLFLLIVNICCTEKESTSKEQIIAYYEGFKNSDYSQVKETLSDSLVIVAGDFITPFTSESYYQQFKWDSVFKPTYKLVKIENQGDQAIATITLSSAKHEFLINSQMTCSNKFYFKAGKISKIEELDCPNTNWELWGKRVNTLTNWVKLNHPELDGFINDLSMKGAQDYMKAIELYEQREIKVLE